MISLATSSTAASSVSEGIVRHLDRPEAAVEQQRLYAGQEHRTRRADEPEAQRVVR
jgi:hypothetical protein